MSNPFTDALDNRGPYASLIPQISRTVFEKYDPKFRRLFQQRYRAQHAEGASPEAKKRASEQFAKKAEVLLKQENEEFHRTLAKAIAKAIAKAMKQGEVSKTMRSGVTNNPFAPPGTGGSGPTPRHGTPVRAHGRTSCRGNKHSVRGHIRNG